MTRCRKHRCEREAKNDGGLCLYHAGSSKDLTELEKARLLPRPTTPMPNIRRATLDEAIAWLETRGSAA